VAAVSVQQVQNKRAKWFDITAGMRTITDTWEVSMKKMVVFQYKYA
jgi:hypothetical protein